VKGVFITFEGPDASGKTTQIQRLKNRLEDLGEDVLLTREPGGTPISEKIRQIILDKDNDEMGAVTEALLYAAARAQHVSEVIKPALEAGKVVISDRFLDSSVAYQGFGRNLGDIVKIINEPAAAGLKPDITFLLVAEPALLRRRRSADEEDRMDSQANEFHRRVVEGYLKIAEEEPQRVYLIDALKDAEIIGDEIWEIISFIVSNKEAVPHKA